MTTVGKPEEVPNLEGVTWRQVADRMAQAILRTREFVGEERLPPIEGWEWFDAMRLYDAMVKDDNQSNLIDHAKRELIATGWYRDDIAWANTLIAAVSEFTHYGHSGGSAPFAVGMLQELLMFRPLGELTSNPEEWQVMGHSCWQNRRDGRMLSYDGGKTWYNVDDPRWQRRTPQAWLWRRKWNRARVAAGDSKR